MLLQYVYLHYRIYTSNVYAIQFFYILFFYIRTEDNVIYVSTSWEQQGEFNLHPNHVWAPLKLCWATQ